MDLCSGALGCGSLGLFVYIEIYFLAIIGSISVILSINFYVKARKKKKQSRFPIVFFTLGVLLIGLQILLQIYFNHQNTRAGIQQLQDVHSAIQADNVQIYLPHALISNYTGPSAQPLIIRHPSNQQQGRFFYQFDSEGTIYIETKVGDSTLSTCDDLDFGSNALSSRPCTLVTTTSNGAKIYAWQAPGGIFYYIQIGNALILAPVNASLATAIDFAQSLDAVPLASFEPTHK